MIKKIIIALLFASVCQGADVVLGIYSSLSWQAGTGNRVATWGTPTPPAVTSVKTVAHYKMNDNAATYDVIDSSESGTLTGTAIQTTDSLTSSGKINASLSFNGSSDYVTIGDNLNLSTNDFSISVWVKTGSTGDYLGIVEKIGVDPALNAVVLDMGQYGFPRFFWCGGTPNYVTAASSVTINDGEWHLLVAVKQGENIKLYVDSVERGSGTGADGTHDNDQPFAIGTQYIGSPGYYFSGHIDDARVYQTALVQDEIDELYNDGSGTEAELTYVRVPKTTISFDYNFFDSNMKASLEYSSAEYTPDTAFGSLPSCSSTGPRFSFNNWQDASYNVYDTSSTVPSSAMTLHASFSDAGASSDVLYFDLQGGSGSTSAIPLWLNWTFGSGDYGGNNFPSDPTLDGYTFGGWFTGTGGSGTQIFDYDYYYSGGSFTVYAYWY